MPRYVKLGDGETEMCADPGPPSLRRAHSTRERPEELPRRSVSKMQVDQQPQQGFLRRAKSSREHPNNGLLGSKLGPLEAAVHRAVAGEGNQQDDVHHKSARGYSGLFRQQQQAAHLPRTQSMRYNRIVSADSDREEDEYGPAPPRHSCAVVDKEQHGNGSLKDCPRMVRISASYQTTDGEILSIECAQCGRWLGTVAHKVNLEQGSIKLCQICHPVAEQLKAPEFGTPAPSGLTKKGSSFLRGLRRILGLKKSR